MVTVHKLSCENVPKIGLERRMPVRWSDEEENTSIVFEIECTFRDRKGLLRDLTAIFYQAELNIKSVHTEDMGNNLVKDRFVLETETEDYYIYERLESRLMFKMPELVEMKLISMN